MKSNRQKKWSGQLYRKGALQNKRHIAFDDWQCVFVVSEDGSCAQEYRVRALNMSDKHVAVFHVPVFCDTVPLPFTALGAWAKSGRRTMMVESENWDTRRGQGRFKCVFDPPLAPGECWRFSYGLSLPMLFAGGDDYYVWDVEVPYFEIGGELIFPPSWKITYARWRPSTRSLPPPMITGQTIRWNVPVPEVPSRLHMEIGSSRKRS